MGSEFLKRGGNTIEKQCDAASSKKKFANGEVCKKKLKYVNENSENEFLFKNSDCYHYCRKYTKCKIYIPCSQSKC